jgi:anthranilate phosphoribosyltransferase
MRFLAPVRKGLGVPTTFNFLGPLANPARVKRQVIGVSDETMATRMLGVLRVLGTEQAMVFHGDDGIDELTTSTTSTVHELAHGEVRTFTLDPLDLGIERAPADTLVGGDAPANADATRAVLAGEKGPHRDIAVLNAAAALVVAGLAPDFGVAVESASAAIDDGGAARALEKLVDVSTLARAAEGVEP